MFIPPFSAMTHGFIPDIGKNVQINSIIVFHQQLAVSFYGYFLFKKRSMSEQLDTTQTRNKFL
jgi:hypothetical protein